MKKLSLERRMGKIGWEYVAELLDNCKLEKKCAICIDTWNELRKIAHEEKIKAGWTDYFYQKMRKVV